MLYLDTTTRDAIRAAAPLLPHFHSHTAILPITLVHKWVSMTDGICHLYRALPYKVNRYAYTATTHCRLIRGNSFSHSTTFYITTFPRHHPTIMATCHEQTWTCTTTKHYYSSISFLYLLTCWPWYSGCFSILFHSLVPTSLPLWTIHYSSVLLAVEMWLRLLT